MNHSIWNNSKCWNAHILIRWDQLVVRIAQDSSALLVDPTIQLVLMRPGGHYVAEATHNATDVAEF